MFAAPAFRLDFRRVNAIGGRVACAAFCRARRLADRGGKRVSSTAATAFDAAPSAGAAATALSIRDLVKAYGDGRPVLRGISLDIAPRGVTTVIGPSGSGKSTLIRCINRLVEPTSGAILFEGRDLARLDKRELRDARRRIGMVFQEHNLVERLTVMENVLSGRLGYVSPLGSVGATGLDARRVSRNRRCDQ